MSINDEVDNSVENLRAPRATKRMMVGKQFGVEMLYIIRAAVCVWFVHAIAMNRSHINYTGFHLDSILTGSLEMVVRTTYIPVL